MPIHGTLLVVTSDHGEEFLEHGDVLHGRSQFQELIRVPLLLRGPGLVAPQRIATPVSLVDVAPTLLQLAGVDVPDSLDGKDLSAFWTGDGMSDRYLFGEADHNNQENDMTRAVRHSRVKLHFNRLTKEYELFDLTEDAGEHLDIASQKEEEASRLLAELRLFMAAEEVEAPTRLLSPEEIEKLRSLGCLQ